jgi:hypothetical protein
VPHSSGSSAGASGHLMAGGGAAEDARPGRGKDFDVVPAADGGIGDGHLLLMRERARLLVPRRSGVDGSAAPAGVSRAVSLVRAPSRKYAYFSRTSPLGSRPDSQPATVDGLTPSARATCVRDRCSSSRSVRRSSAGGSRTSSLAAARSASIASSPSSRCLLLR